MKRLTLTVEARNRTSLSKALRAMAALVDLGVEEDFTRISLSESVKFQIDEIGG